MFEKLRDIIVEEFQVDADSVTMESELLKDLGINSIELAELVLDCQDRFGIEIDDDDIHKFVTMGDVVRYLEERNA